MQSHHVAEFRLLQSMTKVVPPRDKGRLWVMPGSDDGEINLYPEAGSGTEVSYLSDWLLHGGPECGKHAD